jgi:protein SCO1/2
MKLLRRVFLSLVVALPALPALAADPSASVYQLDAALTAQDGRAFGLDVYRGHPVLVTLFYSSCQATCPLIIDTLRAVERQVGLEKRQDLRVLVISIDPGRDTVEALAATARERHLDTSRWTLARTDETHVRRIAAVLGVQYRKLPDGQFSHSTMISVLNGRGEIVAQSDQLGRADEKLLAALAEQ